jgi:hypothetical protein
VIRRLRHWIDSHSLIFFWASPSREERIESPAGYIFREILNEEFDIHPVFQQKGRRDRYRSHRAQGHRCYGFVTSLSMPLTARLARSFRR